MGNFVRNQEETKRNQEEIAQSQVQESPNILIKQSKIGNVEIIKLSMQIIEVELIYDSVDKIQLDLTYSSQVNCLLTVYTFITEIKGSKQQRFERTMQESSVQKFKCPQGLNHQIPSRYIEFMITDLLKFNRIRATSEISHHTLILEMRSLTSKSFQIIYFYKIDCNEQQFRCELINTKQLIMYKNRMFEIHELYGVKNTPFNPEWNPNTVEDKECVICFCNIINTVLLPCKHMCTCSICADHILMNQKVKQCPLCRIEIDNYLTLEIKDKEKQNLQLRQFQEGQQKYLDAVKEKKNQQAIKQSSIMEQLQSKVHQDQMRKLKLFDDIEDFQRENQNNQDQENNEICYSNEEIQSDHGNNQIQNSFSGKLKQLSEDENNLKVMQFCEDDKQRYSSKQRISSYDLKQERGILSSFQHSQEKQNDQQQGSDESEILQEVPQVSSSKQQQSQYSFDYMNYDEQSHYNSQQKLTNAEMYQASKQQYQFIQGTDKVLPTIPEYFKESSDVFQQISYNQKDEINNQNILDLQQIKNQQNYFDVQSQIQSQELQISLQQQQQQQQQQQSHRSLMKQKNQQIQFCQLQQNNLQQDDEILNQFEKNDIINQIILGNDLKQSSEAQNKQVLEEFAEGLFVENIQPDESELKNKINIQENQIEFIDNVDNKLFQENIDLGQIKNDAIHSQKK
ncbi:unnamed protein product [Paramecium sonneborni]|uniref:RING-type domain-containing protein n=1 Tax=Paramecium sonneborni TaxID=65129 RepID=A0A8S1L524_9CILI|nr:unnamed protein product [Paramecium sonneborni]